MYVCVNSVVAVILGWACGAATLSLVREGVPLAQVYSASLSPLPSLIHSYSSVHVHKKSLSVKLERIEKIQTWQDWLKHPIFYKVGMIYMVFDMIPFITR